MPIENRWIWPFELLERVGVGGMGEVYKARFVKNDRIVAVKLLPESVSDETILARFEREVGLLRKMRHPHIVHTFGGTTEGTAGGSGRRFYAMEYLTGGTLQDVLNRDGRAAPGDVIRYARQMCDALAFAHGRGVIHRDLKPGNFLLTDDGTLKLADFGLAAVREGNKLTAEGRTMGTFRYMAPEQIRGKPPACPQTDLYALGVVLYELLTGRPPYQGETPAETLQMHLKAPVPRVVAHEPHCPPGLDRLTADLMEKRIEDRPPSAGAVAERLEKLGGKAAIAVRKPPPDRPIPTPPAAEDDDADDLVTAPPPRTAGATADWVKYVAIGSLGLLGLLLPWAVGAAAGGRRPGPGGGPLDRPAGRRRPPRPGRRRPRAGRTGAGRPGELRGAAGRRGARRPRGAVRRRRRPRRVPGATGGSDRETDEGSAGGRV